MQAGLAPSDPGRAVIDALRLALATALLALGLLAVLRAPHGLLWKPAVLATAFGTWLLPLAGVVTLSADPDRASALALVAAVLLATPVLRAIPAVAGARLHVTHAFGDVPWTAPTAASRVAPLTLPALLRPGASGPSPERHVFDPEHGLALELYRGQGPGPHPVVVAIHGELAHDRSNNPPGQAKGKPGKGPKKDKDKGHGRSG